MSRERDESWVYAAFMTLGIFILFFPGAFWMLIDAVIEIVGRVL